MMEIALSLMACAVFAALTAVAVTAALKSARVDDIIGEVFSPWIQDPFAASKAPVLAAVPRTEAKRRTPHGADASPNDRQAMAARI